jgi:ATP-dependent helicase IRC3
MDSLKAKFYRDYDLSKARQYRSIRQPAVHQHEALGKLQTWFKTPQFPAGSVLALPTGGGKTFTAIRFLCTSVLPQADYKVLWLAHTHHLLEQAFYSFGPEDIQDQLNSGLPDSGLEVGHITGGRPRLAIRVVSGGKGYHPVHRIKATDDVLICTLQTITKAYQNQHPQLEAFLNSVKPDKLCVVFDEAHHLPATSYRKLICSLRERFPKMHLLGLTATPTYNDQRRRGWLKKLFPQGVK